MLMVPPFVHVEGDPLPSARVGAGSSTENMQPHPLLCLQSLIAGEETEARSMVEAAQVMPKEP